MSLIVLMSTYNGEKYLVEQLDSLISQDLKPNKILIRDDGSNDNTVVILKDYVNKYDYIEYYVGNNIGVYKSFYELICKAGDYDYYALCDQDDVWFKDKLATAVDQLNKNDKNIPLLYASKFTLTDKDLKPINSNVSRLYSYSDFNHALIYHSAPGCTFVFNNKAREKIMMYDMNIRYCLIHDAIIHKVVTMFGKMILDENSHIYYRQHNDNQIGMTANKIDEFKDRINRFLFGKIINYRSNTAKELLDVYGEQVDDDKKRLLRMLAYYQEDGELKKALLHEDSFKTGTINDFFFKLLVLTNRI